jgi:uncharacterized membrane protein
MQHLMYEKTSKEKKIENVRGIIRAIAKEIFTPVLFGLIVSLPIMWLWNLCLVPALTVVKSISWIQAWGLLVLCTILFKSATDSKN